MTYLARLIVENHHQSLALFHCHLDTLLQSSVDVILDSHPVNDSLDIVCLVTVNLHALFDFQHLAIHSDVQIAFTAQTVEEFTIMSLTTAHQWSQNQYLASHIVLGNHLNDLLFRIFHHRLARFIAVSLACAGKKQTHIVVDLSRRSYGRTRILVRRLLLNADDG